MYIVFYINIQIRQRLCSISTPLSIPSEHIAQYNISHYLGEKTQLLTRAELFLFENKLLAVEIILKIVKLSGTHRVRSLPLHFRRIIDIWENRD